MASLDTLVSNSSLWDIKGKGERIADREERSSNDDQVSLKEVHNTLHSKYEESEEDSVGFRRQHKVANIRECHELLKVNGWMYGCSSKHQAPQHVYDVDYVDEWSLMRSPLPMIAIFSTYLVTVLKIGPAFMKGRQPFQLNNILIAYNISQVIISAYLTQVGARLLWKYGLAQNVCMTSVAEVEYHMVTNFYYYFLAKITELTETIFFVLRKKYSQISFLHVYHHSTTFALSWYIVKFDPTPIAMFAGTINSFVHIVMYSYYALSAFPNLNKYLWWKVYITKLQLTQFMLILITVPLDLMYSQCDASFTLFVVLYSNVILMVFLFRNFYKQAYTKKDTVKSDKNGHRKLENGNTNGIGNNENTKQEKLTNGTWKWQMENGNEVYTNEKHNGSDMKYRVFSNGSHEKKIL